MNWSLNNAHVLKQKDLRPFSCLLGQSPMIQALIIIFVLLFSNCHHASTTSHAPDVWTVLRSEFTLNHEQSNPQVQQQIHWLVAHPGFVKTVCHQSAPYIYHIIMQIKKRHLPGELALLPMIESAFNPFAYSKVGAAGLWQIMPNTGSNYGLKQDWWFDGRRSINHSTDAALDYLMYLKKYFNGHWLLAIAAYDAGEGSISRAIKGNKQQRLPIDFWHLRLPNETKIYVPRLLALAEMINNPKHYGLLLPPIAYQPYFEEVNIGRQMNLKHAAQLAGISYRELIGLNPGYNRWTTAPYKPFRLLIPTQKVKNFTFNLAHLSEDKPISWSKCSELSSSYKRIIHIVQHDDSFATIQHRYQIAAKELLLWNKLPNVQSLRAGQQLIIWKKVRCIGD